MKYLTSKEIRNLLGITTMTLTRWKRERKIAYKQISSRKFLFDVDSLGIYDSTEESKKNVIYARVSTTSQKEDLNRQIQLISDYMISSGVKIDKVYSDIASGMNEKRKQFSELLKDITENKIGKIFITYKDRLIRFGFGYFEYLFSIFNTEIVILNNTSEIDSQKELTEDLISIIHHYSMKIYSSRRKKFKEIEKSLKENQE